MQEYEHEKKAPSEGTTQLMDSIATNVQSLICFPTEFITCPLCIDISSDERITNSTECVSEPVVQRKCSNMFCYLQRSYQGQLQLCVASNSCQRTNKWESNDVQWLLMNPLSDVSAGSLVNLYNTGHYPTRSHWLSRHIWGVLWGGNTVWSVSWTKHNEGGGKSCTRRCDFYLPNFQPIGLFCLCRVIERFYVGRTFNYSEAHISCNLQKLLAKQIMKNERKTEKLHKYYDCCWLKRSQIVVTPA